jgi:NAD(P)H dehydrogenase (quinone)
MVLVTGASGKTGRAVISALAGRGQLVRALVHRAPAVEVVLAAGAGEVVVGDMLDECDLRAACRNVAAIYHICPNLHGAEVAMAEMLLRAMAEEGVRRIVYHSVLHPQVEAMPHHWRKMRVEELLFTQDVCWTILQPAAYMQNVFAAWRGIVEEGVYRVPYAVSTRLGMVDLADVAFVAAAVLTEAGHEHGIYELAGAETLDQEQVASVLAQQLGRAVVAEEIPRVEWAEGALRAGQSAEAVDTLLQMFVYYEQYGFSGNATVLETLLRRQPTTFAQAVARRVALAGE